MYERHFLNDGYYVSKYFLETDTLNRLRHMFLYNFLTNESIHMTMPFELVVKLDIREIVKRIFVFIDEKKRFMEANITRCQTFLKKKSEHMFMVRFQDLTVFERYFARIVFLYYLAGLRSKVKQNGSGCLSLEFAKFKNKYLDTTISFNKDRWMDTTQSNIGVVMNNLD